jgi:copper(I)-binding protein
MKLIKPAMAGLAALTLTALPAFADPQISIEDPYARAAGMHAMAGAAFMAISNSGDEADRLVAARAEVSKRVELHTHIESGDGVMQMVEVEEGFTIEAGETRMLKRGGDHVMFMGLTEAFEQDKVITVTLVFEKSGEMVVEIPVDLKR